MSKSLKVSGQDAHEAPQPYAYDLNAPDAPALSDRARPLPRISIQAFCETPTIAEIIQTASEDRRLSKAHVTFQMGGVAAAVAHYQENPTPNLIVLESHLPHAELIGALEDLAQSCDPGTKVVIIGSANDVVLYRDLMKRGISEYLVAPISPFDFMECLSGLYNNPDSDPVGQVLAFVGAKGGVGSSTICHNVAWTLSEAISTNIVIADMDLAFGTTGLDFNQDPVQGIADALQNPERLDEVLLDRLLTTCSKHLSIFAAPVVLDRDYEMSPEGCETVIDVVRQNVPFVAVDLPHTWAPWTKRLLLQADEIVITAIPDLANLRNAKNILDLIRTTRKNDASPHLVLNMANMQKRPEITPKEFESALDIKTLAVIDFDCENFGQAANNGQMVEDFNAKAKAAQAFREIALTLAHRKEIKVEKKSPLAPLLEKLKLMR
ncbi:AAA family ATPase [Hyphomicrobium sp. LHD-15]|uniref:AAA family ATPase n=1 Tax=Hyphomicrobium sp. LHD-15 TaxID=3072142 RepID=UPI00280FEDA4|nr:AAA family ATPase [Hyphomicrobium sp. LHD-15]MDQ8699322.1 AAA family ATPase [Hyphomicrobium sp. LHD-15]